MPPLLLATGLGAGGMAHCGTECVAPVVDLTGVGGWWDGQSWCSDGPPGGWCGKCSSGIASSRTDLAGQRRESTRSTRCRSARVFRVVAVAGQGAAAMTHDLVCCVVWVVNASGEGEQKDYPSRHGARGPGFGPRRSGRRQRLAEPGAWACQLRSGSFNWRLSIS